MSSLNNLNTIAKTLGYIVKKQCGYYLVVRPDCRTGRQCDNLKDVADCLASMIRGELNKLTKTQNEFFNIIEEMPIARTDKDFALAKSGKFDLPN
jgi:hypothetical protein